MVANESHESIARRRAPSTQVYIDREGFTLYLFRLDRLGIYRREKFPIAVGKVGSATPSGAYFIDAKTRTPDWLVPKDEDYDPALWHTVIPFESPENPFKGGFLSISGGEGVGIHGTKFDPRLGTRASHGCIRMAVGDFERIYYRVPLGTPVIIF